MHPPDPSPRQNTTVAATAAPPVFRVCVRHTQTRHKERETRETERTAARGRHAAIGLQHFLSLALLLDLELLLSQNGGDLALHERPGHAGAHQGALLTARAVDFGAGALTLDALARAREAELMVRDGRALHEVGVLEALLAKGAFERRTR